MILSIPLCNPLQKPVFWAHYLLHEVTVILCGIYKNGHKTKGRPRIVLNFSNVVLDNSVKLYCLLEVGVKLSYY